MGCRCMQEPPPAVQKFRINNIHKIFFHPNSRLSEGHLYLLTYCDLHPAGVLLTILVIQYYLVIQALWTAKLGWARRICGAGLLKSLTGAEMRVSIKTDPG